MYNIAMPNFLTYILIALLGWVCGAFVNYLADVLPLRRSLAHPLCLHCQQSFPVLNYFLLPRRCPACQKTRTLRTWVVEIVYIALALVTWFHPSEFLGFWLGLVVLVFFGVVAVIDIEHRVILMQVSMFGVVLGLFVGVAAFGTNWFGTFDLTGDFLSLAPRTLPYGLVKSLIGGLAGFSIMLAFFYVGSLFARILGRMRAEPVGEEALGFGDVTLSGVLGLMVAWDRIIFALFFGILIGGVFSILYLIVKTLARRYQIFTAIPYGPFLIAGASVILFF